jgi:aspartate/methionine/tyrosine aminotransferase
MPIEEESPEEIGYGRIRYNLAESSMPDRKLGELPISFSAGLVLQYTDHRGDRRLRELLAADAGLAADDVMVTHGAVGALFILHTSILGAGDRLLVVRPNYATNLETPFAIGCLMDCFDLEHDNGYNFDVDAFVERIKPDTKLISITTPHNPTGRVTTIREIQLILAAMKARAHPKCYMLVDETYREMVVGGRADVWACALDDRIVSVSSMSKTYGVPGIRIGYVAHDASRNLMCKAPIRLIAGGYTQKIKNCSINSLQPRSK